MDFAQGSQADIFSAAPIRPRARQPISTHPVFAPMLGLWGAGLGAAIALVLPAGVIEAFAASVPADLAPQTARAALAGSAAVVVALLAYGTGRALGRGRNAAPARRVKPGVVEPLDPASELGSDSFDAPLPAGLFAKEPEWLPEPPAADALAAEAAAELAELARRASQAGPKQEQEQEPAAGPADALPAPCELDLAGFAALPGRDAVWVQEPAPLDEALTEDFAEDFVPDFAEPETVTQPNPDPALVSAIERLRAVPPAELSLCEMVERLAAALQDYQAAQDARAESEDSREEREALLSEALGALGRVTGEGRAASSFASTPTLRAQLWAEASGLHEQRGAA